MSEKIKDDKNRWRKKSVGFRVSPEEWDVINDKVMLYNKNCHPILKDFDI